MLVSSHLQHIISTKWIERRKAAEKRFIFPTSRQPIKLLSHQVSGCFCVRRSQIMHCNHYEYKAYEAAEQLVVTSKQTLRCLELLFNRGLIQTANASSERKEINLNPQNLYPGTDSFISESLTVSRANKKLLRGRINTEQGCVCSGPRVHNWQTEAKETLQLHSLQSCF